MTETNNTAVSNTNFFMGTSLKFPRPIADLEQEPDRRLHAEADAESIGIGFVQFLHAVEGIEAQLAAGERG
ncbi:hypothetical protein B4Q13_18300 [Lacticaseibacillus rhamnosus]